MENFLELEGGYLLIGLFALGAATFVGTRPFVGDGKAWKKTVPFVLITMAGFIGAHFFVTTARMSDVKNRSSNGGAVICESKAQRKVEQSIIIDPNLPQGWILIDDEFHSKIITSVFMPEGIDFNNMHDHFFEKGFTIYPGKVSDFNTFRVANIGEIDYRDMEDFLTLFKSYIKNSL